MKASRLLSILFLAATLSGGSACVIRGRAHAVWIVDVAPPPPRVHHHHPRAGYVWLDGHWERVGGAWVWREGYWVRERPDHVWTPGVWVQVGSRWEWREGRWDARPKVRDHREPRDERPKVRDHR